MRPENVPKHALLYSNCVAHRKYSIFPSFSETKEKSVLVFEIFNEFVQSNSQSSEDYWTRLGSMKLKQSHFFKFWKMYMVSAINDHEIEIQGVNGSFWMSSVLFRNEGKWNVTV